ncbi:MAG: methyltransferase domain-containing protein [Proteobacteria bacterium]|nr:methyltransferase domain-containing protein [Pseudomonadota bacterium]
MPETEKCHHDSDLPMEWVARFAPLIAAGGAVLDLACGRGRHSRYLAARGHPVTALDKDIAALKPDDRIETIAHDLEDGSPWPLGARRFAGIVVTNYLHRLILSDIVEAVAPGGVLIYQTFATGNGEFGRPRRPEFLLKPGELLEAVAERCHIVAYENGTVSARRPAAIQRICAVRNDFQTEDGLPPPLYPSGWLGDPTNSNSG